MAKRVGVDKWLFGTVLLLVLFGLVMVFSASAVMSQAQWGSPYKYVAKQGMYALCGMVALFGLMRVDYRRYNSYPVVASAVAVTMMLLLAVFAMHSVNGAHRWIGSGGSLPRLRSRCWCCFWRTFCRRASIRWTTGRARS
jgi:cell division protein FtsW